MANNPENLKSLADRTTEEQREIAIKGGQASGEARRKKKGMRELANIMLGCGANKANIDAIRAIFPDLDIDDVTVEAAILAKQAEKAVKGDLKSAEFLRDTSGQKPEQKTHTRYEEMTPKIIKDDIE